MLKAENNVISCCSARFSFKARMRVAGDRKRKYKPPTKKIRSEKYDLRSRENESDRKQNS